MPWYAKLFATGLVRWLIGTSVQTGVIITFVYYFMSVALVSMDSRMTDIANTNSRIETKLDAGISALKDGQSENSVTLGTYTERFNSIDKEFASVRRELATALAALANSIDKLDKTAAEPLKKWGGTYLALLSDGSDSVVEGKPFLTPSGALVTLEYVNGSRVFSTIKVFEAASTNRIEAPRMWGNGTLQLELKRRGCSVVTTALSSSVSCDW